MVFFAYWVPFLIGTSPGNIISAFDWGVATILWWAEPKDAGFFAVWHERVCLQRNLMHIKKEIQGSPWVLAGLWVRAQYLLFFLTQYVQVSFYPLLQQFLHRGAKICCGHWDQALVGLGIFEMIFDSKSKVFWWINCSWAKAFVVLNNHQFWVALYESDYLTLMRKNIVLDGAKLEVMFQGLAKCL